MRFAAREVADDRLDQMLTGPTAITFVRGDAAAVAKMLRDYARGHHALVLKGGLLGDKVVSAQDVEALADLPPRDVLLAQLAGAFQAPLVKLAGLLQALPRNFAYGLKALIDQRGGPEPEASAEEAAPEPEAAAPEPEAEASAEEAAPEPEPAAPEPDAPVPEPEAAAPEPEAAAPEPEPEASAEAADTDAESPTTDPNDTTDATEAPAQEEE